MGRNARQAAMSAKAHTCKGRQGRQSAGADCAWTTTKMLLGCRSSSINRVMANEGKREHAGVVGEDSTLVVVVVMFMTVQGKEHETE